jgi:predicted RNase H-like nuclease (RuvC/YqgF family)
MGGEWHDLDKAADMIGISSDAVRKRIIRGTLEGKKESGRWKVFIKDNRPDNSGQIPDTVQALRDHIESLKKENARQQRTIDAYQKNQEQINYILALKEQKILELEAPDRQRSWWQKFLKGDR